MSTKTLDLADLATLTTAERALFQVASEVATEQTRIRADMMRELERIATGAARALQQMKTQPTFVPGCFERYSAELIELTSKHEAVVASLRNVEFMASKMDGDAVAVIALAKTVSK